MADTLAAGNLVDALHAIVGTAGVLVDDDVRAGYEIDWTRRFHGRCDAVVRPATTEQVSQVLACCAERGIAVVPQGGNTGLVGGSVPPPVCERPVVVLSTTRLTSIGELEPVAGQITLGAGVTLAALEAAVVGSPWAVGVDLGARASATIGGMVATNAGGTRVLRHGMMRHNLLGLEAVLSDGTVLGHLSGLTKDNTGYDLAALLCGSEGTLAVITAVRLRLVPAVQDSVVAWVACDGWADAVSVSTAARLGLDGLDGLEAVDRASQLVTRDALRLESPLANGPHGVALLVWLEDPTDATLADLAEIVDERPHAIGMDTARARQLWERRDRVTEAIALIGVPHKLDVSIPVASIAAFCEEVPRSIEAASPGAVVYVFGHLGDGNLHVNVVGPDPGDDAVDDAVLQLVARYGGSISAEHGIGRAKQRWLHLSRTDAELAAFRAIKSALDPTSTLNPGVILPA